MNEIKNITSLLIDRLHFFEPNTKFTNSSITIKLKTIPGSFEIRQICVI